MWNECHVFFFVCNFFGWTHLWGKNLKESDDLDHGLQEEVRVPICCAAVRARLVTLDMFWRGKKFDTANGLSNLRYFLLDFYWLNISIRSLNIKLVFLHYISPIFFCTHTGVNQSCLVGTFALRPWKQRWHWKKHGKTTIWRCISPIENGDIRASHVSFQVFFFSMLVNSFRGHARWNGFAYLASLVCAGETWNIWSGRDVANGWTPKIGLEEESFRLQLGELGAYLNPVAGNKSFLRILWREPVLWPVLSTVKPNGFGHPKTMEHWWFPRVGTHRRWFRWYVFVLNPWQLGLR